MEGSIVQKGHGMQEMHHPHVNDVFPCCSYSYFIMTLLDVFL